MKRMTLPALLAAALLAFCLAGCSQAQNMSPEMLKGVWKLDSGSNVGFDAYISFEDDDIVEMIIADSWLDGTWSVSGSSGSITFEDDTYIEEEEDSSSSSSASGSSSSSSSSSASAKKTVKLSYSNNKLTMGSDDGSRLVFVKDDSEEAKQQFAYGMDVDSLTGPDGQEIQYVEEVIDDIDPVTIADDDKFRIVVTGKGTDYTGDPCYRMSITNKMSKSVFIVPEDVFTVGGAKIDAGFGDELNAGETIETEMYFAQDDLGGGLEKLTTVDGVLEVIDNDTDEDIVTYPFHME